MILRFSGSFLFVVPECCRRRDPMPTRDGTGIGAPVRISPTSSLTSPPPNAGRPTAACRTGCGRRQAARTREARDGTAADVLRRGGSVPRAPREPRDGTAAGAGLRGIGDRGWRGRSACPVAAAAATRHAGMRAGSWEGAAPPACRGPRNFFEILENLARGRSGRRCPAGELFFFWWLRRAAGPSPSSSSSSPPPQLPARACGRAIAGSGYTGTDLFRRYS